MDGTSEFAVNRQYLHDRSSTPRAHRIAGADHINVDLVPEHKMQSGPTREAGRACRSCLAIPNSWSAWAVSGGLRPPRHHLSGSHQGSWEPRRPTASPGQRSCSGPGWRGTHARRRAPVSQASSASARWPESVVSGCCGTGCGRSRRRLAPEPRAAVPAPTRPGGTRTRRVVTCQWSARVGNLDGTVLERTPDRRTGG